MQPLRRGDLTEDIPGLQSTADGPAPRTGAAATLAALVAALALAAATACTSPPRGPAVTIHTAGGDVDVAVELALTEAEQARGLMWRSELPDGTGMLFVFDDEEERAFWMRNTPIPLDILYITADATIASIAAETRPYSEQSIPSRGPCRYVLEVPGGWAQRHGVRSGDRLTLPPAVAAAAR